MIQDHSVTATMSGAQFHTMEDEIRSTTGGVDTTAPDCSDITLGSARECYDDYAEWINQNRTAGEQFNDMIQNLGNGYDIAKDFSGA
jgi:hypothetical protein